MSAVQKVSEVLSPAANLALQAIMVQTDNSDAEIVERFLLEEATRQLAIYIRKHAGPLNACQGNAR